MKAHIVENEWFPCFDLADGPRPGAVEVDVDEATLRRWQRTLALYDRCHDEMKAAHDAARWPAAAG